MQIKNLPKSQVEFELVILWEEWKSFIDGAVEKISKDIKIEGFRSGKAPRKIVEQKVGSDLILGTAAEEAIRKFYPNKVKELNLEAIGAPEINIIKLAQENDLVLKVVVSVMPKLTLKNWKDEVKKVNAEYNEEKNEVSDEEIKNELDKLAKSRAKFITVRRAAQKDDAVVIDFEVKRNNVVIEGGTAKDHNLILGSNVFIPGFEEALLGMQEGEEKEFELNFPKEYHDKNLAGKKAQFKVKIKLVQEREIPEINDDFAKSLGNFKDLTELKNNIKTGMAKEREFKKQEKRRSDIMEILINKIELEDEFPEVLVHEELHKMIHELDGQMQQMGTTLDDYLKQIGKTIEDMEKDWEPQAEKRIKAALALEQIIKEKEISISAEKIEEEMNKTLQFYKNVKDAEKGIDMKRLYDYTNGVLKNEEAFKLLEKI